MYFLNYNELKFDYIYKSNIRFIILKQNLNCKNSFMINLPRLDLSFIFLKKIELNSLKIFNNISFFWLLTKQKSNILKLNYKLDRGIRYYRFIIYNKLFYENIIFKFLDFFLNKILYLIEKKYIKSYLFNEKFFFYQISNLDLFSNIRLSNNFFIPKINDKLYLKFFLKNKNFLKIKYFLNLFKFNE